MAKWSAHNSFLPSRRQEDELGDNIAERECSVLKYTQKPRVTLDSSKLQADAHSCQQHVALTSAHKLHSKVIDLQTAYNRLNHGLHLRMGVVPGATHL